MDERRAGERGRKMSKKKVMVTGGAGFIGSNLADAYIEDGYDVVIVDNMSSGNRENLPDNAKFYEIGIESPDMEKVFASERPDFVVHHAAQIDVRKSVEDPALDAKINIIGSLDLLQLALRYPIEKFILASTGGAIYGEQDYFPADEKHIERPISPYGIAKLSVEKYLHYYHVVHGLKYTALRYANVYGPRQNPHGEAGVVAIFCQKLIQNKAPFIFGSGKQSRDFVYVGDVVRANILATKSDFVGSLNIGTGLETDINEVYKSVANALGVDIKAIYRDGKIGEQMRSLLDSSKAKEILAWESITSFDEGIKNTVEYFKNR